MILLPGASTDTKIITQTSKGNNIPNSQCHECTNWERQQYPDLNRKFASATFRTEPNPTYNCHGLVFASRRTAIDLSSAIITILRDDGYVEIEKGNILPGDIIIYYDNSGDFQHSGIVLCLDKSVPVPLVLSKWGKYKEVVHWANYCPYNFSNVRYYRIQSWI
ncbi:MAG: hypothetical protein ACYCZF_03795 [Anaerolineae bacterium]